MPFEHSENSVFGLRAILFDLDGTLADTGPDLAFALNTLLAEEGHVPLPYKEIRPLVSHGGMAMVLYAFSMNAEDPAAKPLRDRLVEIYSRHIADRTRLFPGMEAALEAMENGGLKWGVVTNKPAWLTEPLMDKLGLTARCACIVSGDTLAERKPHPAPILHACRLVGSLPAQSLYVGDALRDIEAGQRAGVATAVALFGYIGAQERPEQWGANMLFEQPGDLLARIRLEIGANE
ncbi:MAG: HAD-IA family hydrolase [Gammaproteobacteria bacterium]|nr:HAD-IA family hydrolase [Gammaproteobacteria bacterium]